jgi:hypothetical protein
VTEAPQKLTYRSRIWRVPCLSGVEAFTAYFTRFSYARHSHDTYALGVIDGGAMDFWARGNVWRVPPRVSSRSIRRRA